MGTEFDSSCTFKSRVYAFSYGDLNSDEEDEIDNGDDSWAT